MRFRTTAPALLFLFLASLAQAAEAPPVPTFPIIDQANASRYGSTLGLACPINVVPGKSLGPIHLGDDITQLVALKLEIKRVLNYHWYVVGPFEVTLDEKNKVTQVHGTLGDLPDCIQYGGKKLAKTSSESDLAHRFPGCGKSWEMVSEGGNMISCRGVWISIGGFGGRRKTPTIRIPD